MNSDLPKSAVSWKDAISKAPEETWKQIDRMFNRADWKWGEINHFYGVMGDVVRKWFRNHAADYGATKTTVWVPELNISLEDFKTPRIEVHRPIVDNKKNARFQQVAKGRPWVPDSIETDDEARAEALASLPDTFTSFVIADVHSPDVDEREWDLKMQVLKHTKNIHLVLWLGDQQDLSAFSTHNNTPYGTNFPTWSQERDDFMKRQDDVYSALQNKDAVWEVILGNHDIRYQLHYQKFMPADIETADRNMAELVRRYGGFWMGWNHNELQFDNLVCQHGTRTGASVMNGIIKDNPDRHVIQGHNHTNEIRRVKHRSGNEHVYVLTGSSQNNPPKYMVDKHIAPTQNWTQNALLFHYTQSTGNLSITNIPFTPDYRAYYMDKELRA